MTADQALYILVFAVVSLYLLIAGLLVGYLWGKEGQP